MVMQRVTGGYLSSQASYSTWRDFGAAVGPLTAPWLFLNIAQSWLFAALGRDDGGRRALLPRAEIASDHPCPDRQ